MKKSEMKKHKHYCPDCSSSYDCIATPCAYPKEYRCPDCFLGINRVPVRDCVFEEHTLYCENCGAYIGDTGTCADSAFCGRCEKTYHGEAAVDAIYVPVSGHDSR